MKMTMTWKIGLLTLICAASAQARPLPGALMHAMTAPLADDLSPGPTPIQPPAPPSEHPATPPSTEPSTQPSEGGERPVIEPLYTCQLPKNESIGLNDDMFVIVFRQSGKLNLVIADKAIKRGIPFEDIQAHLVKDESQVQQLLADEKMAAVLKLANLSDVSSVKQLALFTKEKPESSDSKILPMALFVFADTAGKGLGGVISVGGLLQSPCNPVNR